MVYIRVAVEHFGEEAALVTPKSMELWMLGKRFSQLRAEYDMYMIDNDNNKI